MKDTKIVNQILDVIEKNLDNELTLDKIANELNYSKFYLNRLFSENIGCTIHKYIQKRRLTEAARELVESGEPIIEIAFRAGYNSPQAFTQAFQLLYQYPPGVYRQKGIFFPKQERAVVKSGIVCGYRKCHCMMGRRMAA